MANKKGNKCPAKFSMKRAFPKSVKGIDEEEAWIYYSIRGHFRHNHSFDVNLLKVSTKARDYVDVKLKAGMTPTQVYKSLQIDSEFLKFPGKPISLNYIKDRRRVVAQEFIKANKSRGRTKAGVKVGNESLGSAVRAYNRRKKLELAKNEK